MTTDLTHQSVLLHESIDALAVKADGIYVDATFGRGGHSRQLLSKLNHQGRLIALDRDPQAIEAARPLQNDSRFQIFHTAFDAMGEVLAQQQLTGALDGVLMDLGVSSPQLDDAERGFSFMREGPLDMRMDTSRGQTAAQWLAKADTDEIKRVLKDYGEERFAGRIARKIVETRAEQPLTTTTALAALIAEMVPSREPGKNPATRSFQAIRIQINGELEQIQRALVQALAALKPGGRMAVISFHSLEDRIVKRFMREQSRGEKVPAGLPLTQAQLDASKTLKTIGKAIMPSAAEVAANPRARSSVLRVAEKL